MHFIHFFIHFFIRFSSFFCVSLLITSSLPSFSSSFSSFQIHLGFAKHRLMVDNTSKMTRTFLENFITFLTRASRIFIFNRLISSSLFEHSESFDVLPDFYTVVSTGITSVLFCFHKRTRHLLPTLCKLSSISTLSCPKFNSCARVFYSVTFSTLCIKIRNAVCRNTVEI